MVSLSDMLVCVDSAPMHIGVGTGTKVIAIFGPTDEKKLLPSNDSRFIAVINPDIQCRPCLWEKRQTTCRNTDCLNIAAAKVFQAIEAII